MRSVWILTCVLLAAAPTVAWAGNLNLAWNNSPISEGCWPESPLNMKTFACNTNSGSATLVGSFGLPQDCPDFIGISVLLNGQSDTYWLPDWWQLYNTGSCRAASLSTSADFTIAPQTICVDPWQVLAQGGIGAFQTALYPPPPPTAPPAHNRFALKIAYMLVDPIALTAGVQYYGFKVRFDYRKTVGTGACEGCATGMWLCLENTRVVGLSGEHDQMLTGELDNQAVTWNKQWYRPDDCIRLPGRSCYPTAAQTTTWGRVKMLYR